MRKRLIGLGLILAILTACDMHQPVSTSIALPTEVLVRVQCYYDEEIIFDQLFERAETLVDGTVRVWIGVEYVDMEGDCHIVTR